MHDVIRLGNELHVTVLDAIVHHLHIVAGTPRPEIGDARLSFGSRADRLKDRRHHGIGIFLAAWHDGRSMQCAILSTRHARADIVDALSCKLDGAAFRILVEGVAPIDDQIAFLEEREQLLNDIVNRPARLHHQHDLARPGERVHQLLERITTLDALAPGLPGQELARALDSAVVNRHRKAVPLHVQYQVLPHHRQPDQSNRIFTHFVLLVLLSWAARP